MEYNYYPGCTLSTKAKALDQCARKSAEKLGIVLQELPEWQCCGAVYPLAENAVAERLSAVRALAEAKKRGGKLVTLCSACYHVIKRVNDDMKNNEAIRTKVNNYLNLEEPYEGETEVLHYLEVLQKDVGFEKLQAAVVKPLTDKKVGAYYGCMLLRPKEVLEFDDPENPSILENFIQALGATAVKYDMRNECCAGYLTLTDKQVPEQMATEILTNAKNEGAQELITACPLCAYNLTTNAAEGSKVPVVYFTELLAQALGVQEEGGC